ncbi:MAG: LytR C-terminal domain-containing protein [Gemmatimonadaceae bacterium]
MSEHAKAPPRRQRRTLKRIAIVVVGIILLAAILAASVFIRDRNDSRRAAPPDASIPDAPRVRVQVLNATDTRGLARQATMHLRDRGFDVLEVGNAGEQLDSTLVLDRAGNPELARRVADALGGARVESRPDSSRYLDVTVLLGRAWRPPAEPFYP